MGIALAMVLLRFYVRITYTRNFGIDDWCIAAAMVSAAAFNVTIDFSR